MTQDFKTLPGPHREGTCLLPWLPGPGMGMLISKTPSSHTHSSPLPCEGASQCELGIGPPGNYPSWEDGCVWVAPRPPVWMANLGLDSMAFPACSVSLSLLLGESREGTCSEQTSAGGAGGLGYHCAVGSLVMSAWCLKPRATRNSDPEL